MLCAHIVGVRIKHDHGLLWVLNIHISSTTGNPEQQELLVGNGITDFTIPKMLY